ncbi:hypothetical protein Pla8534_31180 [Lignipirellula cremea]|uniref:Immunity protein 17 n=2 Tax=Lignipirellula cremea TaxID=2528010 RepID=A0A518DTY9_9BACT|nr:hypothetical protein Pla8534_31180 [Lignipirellula cremea]
MHLSGWLLMAVGVFSMCGAYFDWDWFMDSRTARFFSGMLGRTGARVVYLLLGLLVIAIGAAVALGYVKDSFE